MKEKDLAGMWTIKGNPITHDGIAMYSGKSIDQDGSLGLEPDKLYPVLRPYEELLKGCDSFNGKPLINNHEMIGTVEGLTKPDEKNIGGTIFNVRPSCDIEGLIIADMTIFSQELQEEIANGKKELSLGYFCKYRPEVGTYKGERYDFVQYDYEGNHIALVDNGRMGSGVRVFDHKEKTLVFDQMEKITMKPNHTVDSEEYREEITKLLKDASDEKLGKCLDILRPPKEEKKDGEDKDDDKNPEDKPADDKTDTPDENKDGKDKDDKPEEDKDDKDAKDGEDKPEDKKDGEDKDDKPADDKKSGCDEAELMKRALSEFSKREALYKAVEPYTGSFDHAEMTSKEIAKYAAGKMKIAVVDGAEVEIVQAHLNGICSAIKKVSVGDNAEKSSEGMSPKMKEYLGLPK